MENDTTTLTPTVQSVTVTFGVTDFRAFRAWLFEQVADLEAGAIREYYIVDPIPDLSR